MSLNSNSSNFSDIATKGLISRLPEPWRSYGQLARLDRSIGTILLLLPGIFGIFLPYGPSLGTRLYTTLLFALGALLMRSAGCVINDMWDRKIDARVTRTATRPLASGALSMKQAWYLLFYLLSGAAIVLLALPIQCWLLAPIALILVALYPLAKRFTWWPQLIMGFTFGFAAPMGFAASSTKFDLPHLLPGIFLYGGVIFWQLGFDTIYGFQDMEDDARIGVKSSSRRVLPIARPFILICYIAALLLFDASAQLAHLQVMFMLGFLPAAFLLLRQGWRLDPHNPNSCLAAFRFNGIIGTFLALGFILGRL